MRSPSNGDCSASSMRLSSITDGTTCSTRFRLAREETKRFLAPSSAPLTSSPAGASSSADVAALPLGGVKIFISGLARTQSASTRASPQASSVRGSVPSVTAASTSVTSFAAVARRCSGDMWRRSAEYTAARRARDAGADPSMAKRARSSALLLSTAPRALQLLSANTASMKWLYGRSGPLDATVSASRHSDMLARSGEESTRRTRNRVKRGPRHFR
mmetsp:Transcript_2116/g.3309  ORF Transcript_2116/g.3309 Transcript_2116/m.3309 type:complete len:217 (-) Transcript_2116:272-922(-)